MNSDEFLDRLRFSRVCSADAIREFVSFLSDEEKNRVDLLTQRLVDTQLLTQWQVDQLLANNLQLVLGGYRLLDRLGEGGMGVVYVAEQHRTKRRVALKTISRRHTDSEDAVKRFDREVQTLAKLEHPSIVRLYTSEEHNGQHFMVMELIIGVDLASKIVEEGRLSIAESVRIACDVAEGLNHAHEFGIVHRDIKPNNIMIKLADGRVVLLDMGLAKIRDASPHDQILNSITSSGRPLGTPHYMSPEQFLDARNVDFRSDIYSLGCTLYAMLTAQHPYESDDFLQLARLHREEHPRPLQDLRSDVPRSLVDVVNRMMAKQPADRFQQFSELIEALRAVVATPASKQKTVDSAPPDRETESSEAKSDIGVSPSPVPSQQTSVVLYNLGAISIEMVKVPAGPFLAGCSRESAERIVHSLPITNHAEAIDSLTKNVFETREVNSFEISRWPITREQYACFLRATGHPFPPDWTSINVLPAERDLPVTNVDLHDARAFCEWANLRLPIGDEWEKAARGTDGRIYPWGNDFNSNVCNCAERGSRGLVSADLYPESDSPFGIRQSTGNAWDWVDDLRGTPSIRGGSYRSTCQFYGAVTVRMLAEPDFRREDVGFRVVHGKAPQSRVSVAPSHAKKAIPSRGEVIQELEQSLVNIPANSFVSGLNRQMISGLVESLGLSDHDIDTLTSDGAKLVTLSGFKISQFCVTNAQYLAFVRATSCRPPESWDRSIGEGQGPPNSQWSQLPVSGVSQTEATAFCNWVGFRLPASHEWEYAARGDDGRIYPWGNRFDLSKCNGGESTLQAPCAVDSMPEGLSPFGLYHSTGNVFEWVADIAEGVGIIRGGSYACTCEVYGLVGFTMRAEVNLRRPDFGFRVAR